MRRLSPSTLKPWARSQQQITQIELTDDFFYNDYGCIRWDNIRNAYFNDFIDIDRVKDLYLKWREQKEYLWLDGFDYFGDYVTSVFVKASKRGNDVYRHRLKQKFNFLDSLDPVYFFGDWGRKSSPMIFVSLTVDPKRYSMNEAWKQNSYEVHLFETKLRQKYGSFVKFRVWEAHESGFPHCHIVYFFHDTWFDVFNHKDKYRISTKHRDCIKKMWRMGNVDIQGVQDTHGAFNEVKKYITKNIWNEKGHLTNAMICLFNKQMYSLSSRDPYDQQMMQDPYNKDLIEQGVRFYRKDENFVEISPDISIKEDFIGSIWDMDTYLRYYLNSIDLAEPNNAALVKDTLHNCNNEFPEIAFFKFVGVVLYEDLKKFIPTIDENWVILVDPPPDLEGYLGFLHRDINLDKGDPGG